ncbi:STM3941 family protein [Pedobacter frigidisoli]|uniref:STM3941 family protein n=1 Tax=Pedobacter frigidisoli TaxID=2530455 RepID=UPI00292E117A|nr:STM3941 family protein [Pedobacter frigidisoli]
MEFYKNKKKSAQLIIICLGIFISLVVVFLYCIGLFTGDISTKLAGISAVLALILIIVIVRMLLSLNQSAPLLTLSKEGITSAVTAVSKAAGLIYWQDIQDITITKSGWDTLILLHVGRATYYMPIIEKKLSAMAITGIQDSTDTLQIFLTASELDMDAKELLRIIQDYRNKHV